MNKKLKIRNYSEEFLIANRDSYDSIICLQYQENITPYFCFRYLYNYEKENINNRVYYNEIIDKYKKSYTLEKLVETYDIAMEYRIRNKDYIIKPYYRCTGDCTICVEFECDI